MKKGEQAYYAAILAAALICWTPFNALSYVAPFVVIGLVLLSSDGTRLLKRLFVWVYIWVSLVSIYGLVNSEFQFGNAIIAFVTWAGIVVTLLLPGDGMQSPVLLHKTKKLAWNILLIESLWGIAQGIYGYTRTGSFDLANGDYVEGTIHPSLEPELTYSNVMFAINMALLLLFLLPEVWRRRSLRNIVVYGLGTLAFVMASVFHAILFLITAVGISWFLIWGRRLRLSRAVGVGIVSGVILVLAGAFLPRNLGTARSFALQIFRGEVPKSVSVVVALTEMPRDYWFLPIIGLGPGQYASRAALISTGLYFGGLDNPRHIRYLPNKVTDAQAQYLLPLWQWHESNRYWGSTQKAYFSSLSVYTEFGLLGLLAVTVTLVFLLRRVHRLLRVYDIEKFVLITAILFIFLLGFQENNWEVPQAWFSGLLFLKTLYANLAVAQPGLERFKFRHVAKVEVENAG